MSSIPDGHFQSKRYELGRYVFTASMPMIGGREQWWLLVGDNVFDTLLGPFDTLEAAMAKASGLVPPAPMPQNAKFLLWDVVLWAWECPKTPDMPLGLTRCIMHAGRYSAAEALPRLRLNKHGINECIPMREEDMLAANEMLKAQDEVEGAKQ